MRIGISLSKRAHLTLTQNKDRKKKSSLSPPQTKEKELTLSPPQTINKYINKISLNPKRKGKPQVGKNGKRKCAPIPPAPKIRETEARKGKSNSGVIILFGYNFSNLDFPKSHVLHDFFFEACKGWFLFQSETVLIKESLMIKSGHTYTSISTKIARNTVFQGPTHLIPPLLHCRDTM